LKYTCNLSPPNPDLITHLEPGNINLREIYEVYNVQANANISGTKFEPRLKFKPRLKFFKSGLWNTNVHP